jgi:hypothetical protein
MKQKRKSSDNKERQTSKAHGKPSVGVVIFAASPTKQKR